MTGALERLELGTVRLAIAKRARTPLGAMAAQSLTPLSEIEEAKQRIELITQGRELLDRAEEPPLSGGGDIAAFLDLGEKGARLDGEALRAIAKTMAVGAAMRRFLLAREELVPGLFAIGASIADQQRTADEVLGCFDRDGGLSDEASAELGPLRKRLRSLHEKVEERLRELLHSEQMQNVLQESYFTVRGDRYVLPIKASYKNDVSGIVHDASGSGQTVFIEPQDIVDIGNRLKIAQSEVRDEEERILSELTEIVIREADATRTALDAIRELDLIMACSRLAQDLDCRAIIPSAEPRLELRRARHPLLALQKLDDASQTLVPNDLALLEGQRVLILTGPNTGGKTVALKTVGMCALMVRMGLHLPCGEESRIGWFSHVDATIGDQQSIASHLSTFAAHMKDLIRILAAAGPHSLVLLDEVAADTDPMQGQALAQALLEGFADRGSFTIATTHFEQLKAVPYSDSRFRNAGVGFDPNALRPTYRVALDLPQSSSAMEIAISLGLPTQVVDRARDLTGESNQALEALMRSVQEKTAELEAARASAAKQAKELETERDRLSEERARLTELQERLLHGEREELVEEIESKRRQVRSMIAELQSVHSSEAVRDAMRLAQEAAQQLAKRQEEEVERLEASRAANEGSGQALDHAEVGDWVHVPKLQKDGEVVALDGKVVLIAVGSMRTRLSLEDLEPAKTKRPKKTRAASKEIKKALEVARLSTEERVFTSDEELDLRGHTIEEAIARIDTFLDHHYQGSSTHVRLVHGHGSGALKKGVRDYLTRSGYAKSWRPGNENEGGDGATVVALT